MLRTISRVPMPKARPKARAPAPRNRLVTILTISVSIFNCPIAIMATMKTIRAETSLPRVPAEPIPALSAAWVTLSPANPADRGPQNHQQQRGDHVGQVAEESPNRVRDGYQPKRIAGCLGQ